MDLSVRRKHSETDFCDEPVSFHWGMEEKWLWLCVLLTQMSAPDPLLQRTTSPIILYCYHKQWPAEWSSYLNKAELNRFPLRSIFSSFFYGFIVFFAHTGTKEMCGFLTTIPNYKPIIIMIKLAWVAHLSLILPDIKNQFVSKLSLWDESVFLFFFQSSRYKYFLSFRKRLLFLKWNDGFLSNKDQ